MLASKSQPGRPSVGAIWLLTSLLTDSLKCGFLISTCEGSGRWQPLANGKEEYVLCYVLSCQVFRTETYVNDRVRTSSEWSPGTQLDDTFGLAFQ